MCSKITKREVVRLCFLQTGQEMSHFINATLHIVTVGGGNPACLKKGQFLFFFPPSQINTCGLSSRHLLIWDVIDQFKGLKILNCQGSVTTPPLPNYVEALRHYVAQNICLSLGKMM